MTSIGGTKRGLNMSKILSHAYFGKYLAEWEMFPKMAEVDQVACDWKAIPLRGKKSLSMCLLEKGETCLYMSDKEK